VCELSLAAIVRDPVSGRVMQIQTTEPGIQFYSSNFIDPPIKGANAKVYSRYGALCLETQHFPDSPNQPSFPTTILLPGQVYRQTTIHIFGRE